MLLLQVNPRSSVLHTYVGMTMHKQGMHDRALIKLGVSQPIGLIWQQHSSTVAGRLAGQQLAVCVIRSTLRHFLFSKFIKIGAAPLSLQAARNSSTRQLLFCACNMTWQSALLLIVAQEAIDLDRRNPLARYERSNVLTMLDRCEEALEELKLLGHIAPSEASVFFQVREAAVVCWCVWGGPRP